MVEWLREGAGRVRVPRGDVVVPNVVGNAHKAISHVIYHVGNCFMANSGDRNMTTGTLVALGMSGAGAGLTHCGSDTARSRCSDPGATLPAHVHGAR